jgi:DNA-binding YbaB/EbfC family protein
MKQAQQMQAQMAKLQEEAATKTVTGSAGGGMVTVTANGALEVVSVRIDPEALKDADAEMLQDVVLAATNEALKNARQLMAEQMKSVTGGMNIPGLF